MRASFGDFVIDFETRQLLREGHPLHVTPKAYQLLALLVEAQPRVLSKQELQRGLWPSTFVHEANLSVLVAELRATLGDDARRPRYVRTVHGFGYACAAEVTRESGRAPEPPGSSAWWLYSTELQFKLKSGENMVGREPPIDVWLDSGSVSRRHARLVVEGTDVAIEDLGSKNGTWRNGTRVTTRVAASHGDDLRFGAVPMQLRRVTASHPTDTIDQ